MASFPVEREAAEQVSKAKFAPQAGVGKAYRNQAGVERTTRRPFQPGKTITSRTGGVQAPPYGNKQSMKTMAIKRFAKRQFESSG